MKKTLSTKETIVFYIASISFGSGLLLPVRTETHFIFSFTLILVGLFSWILFGCMLIYEYGYYRFKKGGISND